MTHVEVNVYGVAVKVSNGAPVDRFSRNRHKSKHPIQSTISVF